ILSALLLLSFTGCGNTTVSDELSSQTTASGAITLSSSETEETRTITDLGGNTVTLPPAKKIKRVVIISPPTTSVLLGVIPDTEMIVGINGRAFTTANTEIVEKLFPNWGSVKTDFVSEGFVSNTEELLKLEPDIVFYYGESQKPGIKNLGIPTVDFMIKGENNPEIVTISWDNLMRQIFDKEGSTTLEKEWKASNQKGQEVLSTYKGERKSALFLFSNMGGIITVYGSGTYADTWFEKSGLINAAADVKGQAEVSMEQLYEWNPDFIYVFIGSPASAMLQNKMQGQDWSLLSAYQNKAIIDIPQAIYSWGAPCADAPLMPLWMISKSYPELLSKNDFSELFSKYYERMYGIELGSDLIATVLSPRTPQK
ncbi:MAG TPA: ABC transporter substrate-binding protein, partial [Negativicutes bacterium]|nr:ABC transporter substrate-binding protein [Negativicutes bacterium]